MTPPPSAKPADLRQDLQNDLHQRQKKISDLEARLFEIAEAEQADAELIKMKDELTTITEEHSSGFKDFNFNESDKAVSEMIEMIDRFRNYPLDEDEHTLLKSSQRAADIEAKFRVIANVYDPLLELAEKLCKRQSEMNKELEDLRRDEEDLLLKLKLTD